MLSFPAVRDKKNETTEKKFVIDTNVQLDSDMKVKDIDRINKNYMLLYADKWF